MQEHCTYKKYNRLELLLLGNTMEDFMDFQPYTKKGLYIITSTDFILYNKASTQEQKIKFIDGVVNNRIQISEMNNYEDGYFSDYSFYDYTIRNRDIVLFQFLSINTGEEHTALPFLEDEPCDSSEVFGYFEDGTILGSQKTQEYMDRLYEQERLQTLKGMATVSYNCNILLNVEVAELVSEYYGHAVTTEDVKRKFKELAKIHHPDIGGNELVFMAISNIKQYLIDQIRNKGIYVQGGNGQ